MIKQGICKKTFITLYQVPSTNKFTVPCQIFLNITLQCNNNSKKNQHRNALCTSTAMEKIFTHQQPYKDIFVLYWFYLRILLILCSLSRSSPSLSELVLIKFSFLIFFVEIFSSELIILYISEDSEKKNFTFVDHILRLSPYRLGEVPCALKHKFEIFS